MVENNLEKTKTQTALTDLSLSGQYPRVVLCVMLLVIVTFIAWRSINYVSGTRPLYDSSIFSGIARHMMAGRALYRDIWDTKPPMIFLLNLWALKIGDGTINAIRLAERFFAVAGGLLLFSMVFAVFRNMWLAFFTAVFFLIHLYYPKTFIRGNLTEEYGAFFLVGGISAAFAAFYLRGAVSTAMAFLSGFIFSLAALCKETFVLSALPWFVYVAWPRDGKAKSTLIYAVLFVVGALTPVLMIALWLLANGALLDWVRTTLHSFDYVSREPSKLLTNIENAHERLAEVLAITRIAAALGLASMLDWAFVKKYHYLPLPIFASALTGFAATCLSGRDYGHYYMQVVPTYVLLGTCGLAFIAELLSRAKVQPAMVLFLLVAGLIFADGMYLKDFGRLLARPARRWEGDELTQLVLNYTGPTDKIWAPSFPYTHLYLDTGRLSSTKWFIFIEGWPRDTAYGTKQQKIDSLREQLAFDPPRLIIISNYGMSLLENIGLTDWLRSYYKRVLAPETDKARALQIWAYQKQAPARPKSMGQTPGTK